MAAAKRNAAGKRGASKSARVDRARTIAEAMPLVHYPANARLTQWLSWGGLASGSERGVPPKPGPFGELRNNHVFVYAGPCCYHHHDCIGDAVIYFACGAQSGRSGGATSFDSGSLEDSPPKLQPFRKDNAPEAKRWRFFKKYQVSLEGWREHFAVWLADCYDDPNRYMESGADRHAAGQPDRTTPAALLQHNGTRGRNEVQRRLR